MSNRAIPELVRKLREEGYTVEQGRRSAHWQVRRGAQLIMVLSATPGDRKSVNNALAGIRRAERQRNQQEGKTDG